MYTVGVGSKDGLVKVCGNEVDLTVARCVRSRIDRSVSQSSKVAVLVAALCATYGGSVEVLMTSRKRSAYVRSRCRLPARISSDSTRLGFT